MNVSCSQVPVNELNWRWTDWRWRANTRRHAILPNYTPSPMPTATSKTLFNLVVAMLGVASVAAQTTGTTNAQEVVKLERVVVTGSNLSVTTDTIPVEVLTSANIADSGVGTDLLEALRKQDPAFSGGGNLGLSNAETGVTSTYGGSKIAIHNMSTLVLLDGQRIATNGAHGRGGTSLAACSMPRSA